MFGIGMPEMLLILVVALIVFGPKKLPDLAKSIGRAFGEFRKATAELKESIDIDDDFRDVAKNFDNLNNDVKDAISGTEELENRVQTISKPYPGISEEDKDTSPEADKTDLKNKAADPDLNSGGPDDERR